MGDNAHTDWTIWLRQQRRVVINILIRFIVVLGTIGMLITLERVLRERTLTFNTVYYTTAYVLVLVLTLARIPDTLRSLGFVLLLYAFGALSLYSGWLAGSGRVFLLTAIVTSAVLINPRAGLHAAGAAFLTYVLFSLAFHLGWLELGPLPDPTSFTPVIFEGLGYTMNIIMVAGSLWFFGRALMAADRANHEAQEARALLAARTRELEAANQWIAQQSQDALRASEEKYRRLVEMSPVPMWINTDGIIAYVNPAALPVLGAERAEQVVGRPALDFIHPDFHAPVRERIRQLAEGERTVPMLEEKFVRLDGGIVDVEVTATSFVTSTGRSMQVLFQDISRRKANEAEREALIVDLEAKNAELERYAYSVSHDLKAPLVTIRGFLGFLEKDYHARNTDRFRRDLERIAEAAVKMQRLLQELLDYARLRHQENAYEPVPFGELVREALELVHGQVEAGGVRVEVQPGLPVVHGDRSRLVEVLQNLIDNAVKFMGAQPDPRIEVGFEEGEGGLPVFHVRDNGKGIAPEFHERIFGLFNKLDPDSDGTGIGLALVKRIIEGHGGQIWVGSEAGRGATFYFTLGRGGGKPG